MPGLPMGVAPAPVAQLQMEVGRGDYLLGNKISPIQIVEYITSLPNGGGYIVYANIYGFRDGKYIVIITTDFESLYLPPMNPDNGVVRVSGEEPLHTYQNIPLLEGDKCLFVIGAKSRCANKTCGSKPPVP